MKNKYKSIRYADRTRFKTNLPYSDLIENVYCVGNILSIRYKLDLDYKVTKAFDELKNKKDFVIGSIDTFGNMYGKMIGKICKPKQLYISQFDRSIGQDKMYCTLEIKVDDVKFVPNETNISFMKKPIKSAK